MKKTVVINVVGLVPALIGESTPRIKAFRDKAKLAHINPVIPAVTATAHSTYLTGKTPAEHGAVANGWYIRDMAEIKFWRQSNTLVQAPKIWDVAKAEDPTFTCLNMCWWFNMNSTVDYLVTPRPMYPSDGRKIPDCYTKPIDLRDKLQAELGQFPLFTFWGANANITSSKWIADASKIADRLYDPTLSLIYLPHLDYGLQKYGPDLNAVAKDLREIDEVTGDLIDYYEGRGAEVILVSEYGIMPVHRQIHLNRIFREKGWLAYREELGRDMFDPGQSKVFAAADHQLAHIYVQDPSLLEEVRDLVASTEGVAEVLDEEGKRRYHLDHERSGDLVALAEPDAWFTYYFWLDDAKAPDYARTVDIHQKPGYDPAELFFDPEDKFVKVKAGFSLLKKKLGFRSLLEVVPLDGKYVKGSHGVPTASPEDGPVLISKDAALVPNDTIEATDVFGIILDHLHR
ncbi:MAG TPA: alkaline phosphatase family protein [Thermomicrobiales bacterium]|nr:alkaline phosphatase family protein [Thermomicrobiales bacterium]